MFAKSNFQIGARCDFRVPFPLTLNAPLPLKEEYFVILLCVQCKYFPLSHSGQTHQNGNDGGNGRAAAIPSAFSGRHAGRALGSFRRAAERGPTRRSATSPTSSARFDAFALSFATDEQGNIFIVGYQGMIYQLDFTGAKFDESVGDSPAKFSGRSVNTKAGR